MAATPPALPSGALTANHDAELYAFAIVFASISCLSLIMRFSAKAMTKQRLTIDDGLLVAGFIIALGETVMITVAVKKNGWGHHVASLHPNQIINNMKGIYAATLLQCTSLTLCKISLLILLHRVFHVVEGFKRVCWYLGIFVFCWWIAAFFSAAFICYPAPKAWDPALPGTCGNQVLMDKLVPIPWVLTDFLILLAPIPVIHRLSLTKSRKRRVYAAFLIGAATCIVSVIRYRTTYYKLTDFTWNMTPIAIWNMIELHVTVMCPALMLSGPVLSWLSKHILPERTRSNFSSLPSFVRILIPFSRHDNATGKSSSAGTQVKKAQHQPKQQQQTSSSQTLAKERSKEVERKEDIIGPQTV